MSDETLLPISERPTALASPVGRPADLIAAIIGAVGATLSIMAALWFFLGFAENDTRPEHLVSAFVLTGALFSFAIVPFAIVAELARRTYRKGGRRSFQLWTLFLTLPWVGLGIVAVTHTPLPKWSGIVMTGLAFILCLWALVSLILDRGTSPKDPEPITDNTQFTQENDVPVNNI